MFILCKQLNGPVLKSLKPSCLGRNRKKKLTGLDQSQNFAFRFRPGRARAEIFFFTSGRARSEKSFQCRPLVQTSTSKSSIFLKGCNNKRWNLDWIYNFDALTKLTTNVWKHTNSPSPKKAKSACNVMMIIFFYQKI